ncbi:MULTISPECIES: hypothetical protein [unclassified Streptomyces]|uniref:hypothetical protein n=1 Tax=unclassified Streptomyces TaxID=2593676 RepID=UPI0033ACD482
MLPSASARDCARPKGFVQADAGGTFVGLGDLMADEGRADRSFAFTTGKRGGITLIKLWSRSGVSRSVVRECGR